MSAAARVLGPRLTELARFAGIQLRVANEHLSTHGFVKTALGTTVTGWWTPQYQTHVLQTDDSAFVEKMAMNWLMSGHGKSKFVGVVMNGWIEVGGKRHDALILRSRTADQSLRMMAYTPYYNESNKDEPWLPSSVEFPADQAVPPEHNKAALEVMLRSMLGKN
jgi:hypothetical protein